jgi:transposase
VPRIRPRSGSRRLPTVLRREGWRVTHKRVYWRSRVAGLCVRHTLRKNRGSALRPLVPTAQAPNEQGRMDVMSDRLASGQQFRVLTRVDTRSRERPVIEVDRSLTGQRVGAILERLAAQRGHPGQLHAAVEPRERRAEYDGYKRRKGSKVHLAVDTLGHLLALHVTPADGQDRAQVEVLAAAVQEATGEAVELAYVDQGYTGEQPAAAADAHGIRLKVVKLPEARRGFVLLPCRWVVERDFAWTSRFRRLARDDERLPTVLAGLHFVAFACLMLHRLIPVLLVHNRL